MTSSVGELMKTVETLLSKTNDVGQVFVPFRDLVDAILESREKKYVKVLLDIFGQIESRLKWNQKDAEKVQKRLDFYRLMTKAYMSELFKDTAAALDCFLKILNRSIVTITPRNYYKYRNQFCEDFRNGFGLTSYSAMDSFLDLIKTILDRFEAHNFPKDMYLYDTVVGAKALILTYKGSWLESLAIEKERLASMVKFNPSDEEVHKDWLLELPSYYYRVALLQNKLGQMILGQRKNCLKTCEVVLKLFKKLGDFSKHPNVVEKYIYILHYQAISLAKLGSPAATKTISDLQTFMKNDPMAKKFLVENKDSYEHFQVVLKPFMKNEVYDEDELFKEVAEKMKKAKVLFSQKKYYDALQMLFDASKTNIIPEGPSQACNDMELMFWISKCFCKIGAHDKAVHHRDKLLDLLKRFQRLQHSVSVTLIDVHEEQAKCLFYHVGYYEEALEATMNAMKCTQSQHLFKIYAQLLICSNMLREASDFVDHNWQAFDDDQAALIYYLSKNMDKADDILLRSKKSSTLMNFIRVQRWREQGKTDMAVKMYEKDSNLILNLTTGASVNSISYASMHLDIGQEHIFFTSIFRVTDAGCFKIPFWVGLTQMCLDNFNLRDSVKYQKHLVKSLKSNNPAAKKLKKYERELRHWSNSVSISLFVKEKLKLNRLQEPFKMFKFESE